MKREPRNTAGLRLQRLLALVPWVAERDGPRLDEVCERFAVSRDQLIEDLGIVFMVGLHPFTPDQMVDVTVEDDRVWIRYADMFARPLKLRPEEALVLVTAGSALAAFPGGGDGGPLARGLAKLAAVLDVDPGEAMDVDLGMVHGPSFELLGEAVRDRRRVAIEYYSFARDAHTHRTVDPWQVMTDRGQWYLWGHCHQAGGPRSFRLDRISEVAMLDEHFDLPAEASRPAPRYEGAAGDPRATLDLEASDAWVAESYPVDEVQELAGGRYRITLAVTGRAWLERLLVRLGPSAVVTDLDPRLGEPSLGQEAAERILRRYRAGEHRSQSGEQ